MITDLTGFPEDEAGKLTIERKSIQPSGVPKSKLLKGIVIHAKWQ